METDYKFFIDAELFVILIKPFTPRSWKTLKFTRQIFLRLDFHYFVGSRFFFSFFFWPWSEVNKSQLVIKSANNCSYRISSIKRRPRINAASWCVCTNQTQKSHSDHCVDRSLSEPDSNPFYQLWCREGISDIRTLITLCTAVLINMQIVKLRTIWKMTFRQATCFCFFFLLITMLSYQSIVCK